MALNDKLSVQCVHKVAGVAMGPGEVLIYLLEGGTRVDYENRSENLSPSGEDTEYSRCFCSVWSFSDVRIIEEVC